MYNKFKKVFGNLFLYLTLDGTVIKTYNNLISSYIQTIVSADNKI